MSTRRMSHIPDRVVRVPVVPELLMSFRDRSAMDAVETITLHPRQVLRQVAESMNRQHEELRVTLPAYTTWRTAIRAAEAAMSDVDEPVLLMPHGVSNHRFIRQMALESQHHGGPQAELPVARIRSSVDLEQAEFPPAPPERIRQRLREIAKEVAKEPFREPYVSLQVGLCEKRLPVVAANLAIRAIDGTKEDPVVKLKAIDIIWDTGAHHTLVTDELLSEPFRNLLDDSANDPYRSEDRSTVQVDVEIAFTNTSVRMNAIAVVVPRTKMPNQRVGVLFGQHLGIDRLTCLSTPRSVLEAKGEHLEKTVWGDITVTEYLNVDNNIEVL